MEHDDWRSNPERGCKDADVEEFFANVPSGRPDKTWRHPAVIKYCDNCPLEIKAACLEDAISWDTATHYYGVVGGMTANERRYYRRRNYQSQLNRKVS